MAGTEDITLRVVLDDRQAKAGLEGLRSGTAGLAQAAAGAAGDGGGGGGLAALNDQLGSLSSIGTASSQALNRISSNLGGVSTGAGRALGRLGRLGTALGAGGPLAVGILFAGEGLSWLIGKYGESAKAAEESAKRQQEAINNIVKAGLDPLEAATLDLMRAKKQLDLNKLLTGDDSDSITRAVTPIRMEMENLQNQIANTRGTITALQDTLSRPLGLGESSEQYMAARESAAQEIKAQRARLDLLQQAFRIRASEIGIVNESLTIEKELADAKKVRAPDAQPPFPRRPRKAVDEAKKESDEIIEIVTDEYDTLIALGFDANAVRLQLSGEYNRQQDKLREENKRKDKEDADNKIKLQEETAKRIEEIQKRTASIGTDVASGAFSLLVGTVNDMVVGMVTGQEMAAEKAAAAFLSGIGNQLVGIGTKALIEGAIISANPLTPGLGAPMMALGAGAIAAGIGFGAAGAGISAAIAGGSATTATAAAGPATTSTPMGAGRISGSQRDRGGPMQEAITYVFNAPVFGDQNRSAKHVALLQRRAQRDLLLA